MKNYPTVKKECNSLLSDWGPYSKQLAGITGIENTDDADRIEFSVFPGWFRGPVTLPCELWQGNHYPWYADADLRSYTYRFELEWKDRVYVDVSYLVKDQEQVLVKAVCTNATEAKQNLCLHTLANRVFVQSPEPDGANHWIDPLTYDAIKINSDDPRKGLTPDARLRGEIPGVPFCFGHALGEPFGRAAGDCVKYTVSADGSDTLFLHAKGSGELVFEGAAVGKITVTSEDFTFYRLPVCLGQSVLTLTCKTPGALTIDAIGFGQSSDSPRLAASEKSLRPEIVRGENRVILQYNRMDHCYGMAWQSEGVVREFLTDNIQYLMPFSTQNHVQTVIGKSSDGQYTNIFIRPILLMPGETKTLYMLICRGSQDEVDRKLSDFAGRTHFEEFPAPFEDTNEYSLGQRLMRAVLLTNVVYPIRRQGNYIRHFTPGKWWDSLYTWDNGFIALGFCDIAPRLAEECLSTYLTEPGNIHAAFVHHGSMVPVQAYVYKRLYDINGSADFLKKYYPSLRQYYDFYVGRDPRSRTRRLKSGLLCTFGYFYNSGGWDDYPAQQAVDKAKTAQFCAPVVNTAHAINFARILMHAAQVLGLDDKDFVSDIKAFTDALHRYSYDKESGYFGYLMHDADLNPVGILRYPDGQNYNKGLDGAYPALVGACSKEERDELLKKIMSPEAMWTEIGISVVDQSAPYYSKTGYWNGSVWMPHQWFAFLGMLECGANDYAAKIAFTALDLWKKETDYSYRCCEHFMIDSERGAGWMCFGALSSPVVMWYESLYQTGNVTAPICLRVSQKERTDNTLRFRCDPCSGENDFCTVIAVPGSTDAAVKVNGVAVTSEKHGNALFLSLPKNVVSYVEMTW